MTMYNLESWHHDVSHLPGLLHVLSGGLCYHAMLATTVISSPWVGVHLDETVLNSDRITPEKDQRSNAINIVYIYIYTQEAFELPMFLLLQDFRVLIFILTLGYKLISHWARFWSLPKVVSPWLAIHEIYYHGIHPRSLVVGRQAFLYWVLVAFQEGVQGRQAPRSSGGCSREHSEHLNP